MKAIRYKLEIGYDEVHNDFEVFLEEGSNGEFVLYKDYEKLQKENEELKQELEIGANQYASVVVENEKLIRVIKHINPICCDSRKGISTVFWSTMDITIPAEFVQFLNLHARELVNPKEGETK